DDRAVGLSATAKLKLHARIHEWIVGSILGLDEVKNRIHGDSARVTLGIFYAKTRMGWSETLKRQHAREDGGPIRTENAHQFISAALDKIAARLDGNASSDAPEDGSGEDPAEDQAG